MITSVSHRSIQAGRALIGGHPSLIRLWAARRPGRRRSERIAPLPRRAAGRFTRFLAGLLAVIAAAKLHRLGRELALRGVRYDSAPRATMRAGCRA